MKGSSSSAGAMSVFQKAIILGLAAQVLLLLCGVAYVSQLLLTSATPLATGIADGGGGGGAGDVVRQALHLLRPDPAADMLRGADRAVFGASSEASDSATSKEHHPLTAMIQSYAPPGHDPTQRRQCFAFTAVPDEIDRLLQHVDSILNYDRYARVIDCIHLSIPHRALRFGSERYPTTAELQKRINDPRIVLHRLFDYGPMTRYIGPLAYERHPDTSIVIFDMDSENMMGSLPKDLVALFHAARFLDPTAMWCLQGENFVVEHGRVEPAWDTFPSHFTSNLEWNLVHFCRGVGGLLFKPGQFRGFWYNQSEYHESCFWDDDRWVGYQMERLGVPLKVIHAPKTKLLDVQPLLDENERGRRNSGSRRLMEGSEDAGGGDPPMVWDLPPLAWADDAANATAAPVPRGSRRRLGSLTQITNALKSDQTCPLAWLQHHPDAFPTAQHKKDDAAAAAGGVRKLQLSIAGARGATTGGGARPEPSKPVTDPRHSAKDNRPVPLLVLETDSEPDWNSVTRDEQSGAFRLRRKNRADGRIGAAANKVVVDDDDDDDVGQRRDIPAVQ